MNTIPSALRAAFLFALIIVPLHGHAEESAAAVTDPILATAPSTLMDVFYNARTYLDEAQDIPSDAPKLGLAEVVQRAVEHSGTLKAAEELVIQREAQGEQARSARKPQVSTQLQLAYLGGLKQEIKTTPIADLIIDTKSFELGEALANGSIAVQQVIYAGGKIAAGIRATGHLTDAERLQQQAALTDVALEATRAYYQSLLAKAIVRVARESAENFESHLADANKALEVGAVSRFEVIRAQTELTSRKADLLKANSADDVATLNLRRLTGIEGEGPIYLEPDWFTAALPTEAVESLIEEALANRPELNALGKSIEAAEEQVNVKKADSRPQVAGLMQYQYIEGGGEAIPRGLAATVGVRWDWYTGGRVKNQVLEAKSQVRQLQHQRNEAERAVKLDVQQSYLRSKEAAQRILMQFATVRLAEEAQSLADLRFKQGVGTQTETLDADLALAQARTALVQALGDYFLAQADLSKASGRGWQASNVGAPKEGSDAAPVEAAPATP